MTRIGNARVAGFSLLFYIAVGITQMTLSSGFRADSIDAKLMLLAQHATEARINALLTLLTCITALALSTALLGLTRDEDRDLAAFAWCCRVGEGLLAGIGCMIGLELLELATSRNGNSTSVTLIADLLIQGRTWITLISATLFAFGSTVFASLLLRGRMIPTWLGWLGVMASILLVFSLPLQILGSVKGVWGQLIWIPMAAFEIPLGFLLLFKGVRS